MKPRHLSSVVQTVVEEVEVCPVFLSDHDPERDRLHMTFDRVTSGIPGDCRPIIGRTGHIWSQKIERRHDKGQDSHWELQKVDVKRRQISWIIFDYSPRHHNTTTDRWSVNN